MRVIEFFRRLPFRLPCQNVTQMNDFGDWLTAEAHARGWSLNELARRSGRGSSTVSMIATGQNRPGLDLCISVAHAFGIPPEDVLRRAGLLPALPPAVEEERELVAIIRDQAAPVRRTLVAMLRGLARRPAPALNEGNTTYGTTADEDELLAIYRRLDPIWRPELVHAARAFAQNAHAGEPRIIGDVEEERSQPQSN